MSTRNRERRKAKQRVRTQRRRERTAAGPGGHAYYGEAFGMWGSVLTAAKLTAAELADAVLADAVAAEHRDDTEELERCVKLLAEGPGGPAGTGPAGTGPAGTGVVDAAVMARLQRAIGHSWVHGWQPADLVRVVGRRLGPRHARMAADVVAAELRRYATATVDERWDKQLRSLGADVWWDRDDGYLEAWGRREDLARAVAVRCAVELLSTIEVVPVIPVLGPPPGAARRGSLAAAQRADKADPAMLDRIRALLSKAESTEFPDEAEAFTAKAQQLMARHSIDYALLAAQVGSREEPGGIRVGVDNPYEAAKALLLQEVAGANRCRTVWSKELGFATVLGFPADLEAVELLYTSLLVQATAAMLHAGSRRDAAGRSRTRSFRQSFLNAYALRIGQRLRAASQQASDEATAAAGDGRLLPVLAARDDAVRATVEAMFPGFVNRRVRVTDRDGWLSGTAAADRAVLHARQEVSETAGRP